jgi:glycosyltransferase involved in cell wall biosynthesis
MVLMSTYCGERYVAEQMQSILSQLPAGGRILVRDDGSNDKTVAAIEALQDRRIKVIRGHNLGFGASFLTLLAQVPHGVDMVLFADQDDFWLPGKIARAWQHLKPFGDTPALYGSAQMLADASLRPMHATPAWPHGPSLASALTENIITGCTAALNRSAVQLLQSAPVPQGVRFHDWWLYLVLSALGQVVYDNEPTLLYRQHGNNQIGHGAGWWGRHMHILRFLWLNDWVGILLGQVAALMTHYGQALDPGARELILQHFQFYGGRARPRWSLILSTRRWRQGLVWDLALRLLLALHRLHLWPLPTRRLRP